MNICIINVDAKPQFIGGIKRVCVSLAHQWVQHGINVIFVCVGDLNKMYDSVAGISQVHLPEPDDVLSSVNKIFLSRFIQERDVDILFNPFMDCKDATRLTFEVSKACKVKLVAAWHFSPTHFTDIVDNSLFVRYKLGNPIKQFIIDLLLWIRWYGYKRKKTDNLRSAYFRECIDNSDKVVFLSKYYLPIVEQMVGCRSDKVTSIVNPRSFEVHKEVLQKKEKIVLWAGRLGYDMKRTDKALSIWKRICNKHKDWKLVICGSGNKDYFHRLCDKFYIDNVVFPGFVSMEEYYSKSSILCNTSVTEGLPMVLNEAMEYGCVPMSFDSYASVHDIIEDKENGFIIPAFNEEEYAKKLDSLMSDEDLRLAMVNKGRNFLSRFDSKMIALQWINLFNSILHSNPNKR